MNKKKKKKEILILITRLEKRLNKALLVETRFSYYRFAIFIAGVITTLILFFLTDDLYTIISLIAFLLLFAVTAHLHSKLSARIKRLRKWIYIKKTHIARMDLSWENIPKPILKNNNISAVERDLNLVGDRSLLHLISTCSTQEGTQLLRTFITQEEPDYEEVLNRQKLVKELSVLHKFRDKLLLVSSSARSKEQNNNFTEWLYKKEIACRS